MAIAIGILADVGREAAAATEVETTLSGVFAAPQNLVSATAPLSDSLVETIGTSSTFNTAIADFGVLEGSSLSFSDDEGIGGQSIAIFRDDWNIVPDDASLNNTGGSLTFQVRVVGALDHQVSGVGDYSAGGEARYQVSANGLIATDGRLAVDPGPSGFGAVETFTGTPLGTPIQIEYFFAFGIPAEFEVIFVVGSGANTTVIPPGQAELTALADLTLAWDGILEVRRDGGAVVEDFSVSSGSGVNWVQPVPEPSSAPMFAMAGLFLLGWARRRHWGHATR